MKRRCRTLTQDSAHLKPGDEVYVDFAGFVYDGSFVDERCRVSKSEAAAAKLMELKPGRFLRTVKLFGLIPIRTEVEMG